MSKRNLFFKLTDTESKYTEEALFECVKSILFDGGKPANIIHEEAERIYNAKVNFSALKDFLDEFFKKDKKRFYWKSEISLFDYSDNDKNEIIKAEIELKELSLDSTDNLYKNLYKFLVNPDKNLEESVNHLFALEIKRDTVSSEYYARKQVRLFNNIAEYTNRLNRAINNMLELNYNIPCTSFLQNKTTERLFATYDIYVAKDLKNANKNLLIALMSLDIDKSLEGIEALTSDYEARINSIINNRINQAIKGRTYEVLIRRNGYFITQNETLETIGDSLGVTRERIRQIEAKGNKAITNIAESMSPAVLTFFGFHVNDKGYSYRRVKDIYKETEDLSALFNACLLLKYIDITYDYDETYHIVYDKSTISIEDIEKSVELEFGPLFSKSKYDEASALQKDIIDNLYVVSGKNKNVYKLKSYNKSSFLIDIIGETFPNGYRSYNDEDYSQLVEEYKNKLGEDIDIPSMDAVRGILWRGEFCQVNKGTYKLRKECVSLPLPLFNKIFDFIVDHLPAVDYITIYKNFETEFKELGIDNYYYMKGLVDYSLPDDLTTKRNYITETDNRSTAVEVRLAFMREFDGPFNIADFESRFPGVKPYVFQFLCYNEENNGLIQIGNKQYIYYDRLNVNKDTKSKLKNIIDNLFASTNSEVLSSRKIYAKLRLLHEDLLDRLPYIDNQFSLFSILKYMFSSDYYFDRPYISKEKVEDSKITTHGLIYDYLESLDIVDYEKYKNYCLKMNIRMPYTYMQIVDELSDNYIQVSNRQLIKKELFGLDEEKIKSIKEVLDLIYTKSNCIDTSTFKGYGIMPQLKYRWDKHLLAGVIRTYFADYYEIENIMVGAKSEAENYRIWRYIDERD